MIRADMHIHTHYSDGVNLPENIIDEAKRRGVGLISVTDHDNCNAYTELAALKSERVKMVVGEEVSAYYGCTKVHVLAYGMDTDCADFKNFNARLYDAAEERTRDILEKLAWAGINITMEEVEANRVCKASPLHAMYIAAAAEKRGTYGSRYDFYSRYLAYGKAGYSQLGRPSPEETIELISKCGGISSLAHPGRITLNKVDLEDLVKLLVGCGLSGIEAVYSGHTNEQTQYYKEMSERYGLLVTGGSDMHYIYGNRRIGDPPFYPDERLLSALKLH